MDYTTIDLGAGQNPQDEHAFTVDKHEHNSPDLVQDLEEESWDLPTNQFELVYMSHVLEHLENWQNALKEVYRISGDGAIVHLYVPHFSASIQIPDHSTHFSAHGLQKFIQEGGQEYIRDVEFEILSTELNWTMHGEGGEEFRQTLAKIINPILHTRLSPYIDEFFWPLFGRIAEIHWELRVDKG